MCYLSCLMFLFSVERLLFYIWLFRFFILFYFFYKCVYCIRIQCSLITKAAMLHNYFRRILNLGEIF